MDDFIKRLSTNEQEEFFYSLYHSRIVIGNHPFRTETGLKMMIKQFVEDFNKF